MTILEERPDTNLDVDTGDPQVKHIGRADDVTRAYITGTPIEALCGVIFVPSRDPDKYPLCQRCAEILERIKTARNGTN